MGDHLGTPIFMPEHTKVADLPTLGVSFSWDVLETEVHWLNEAGRDLEVSASHAILDNGREARIETAKRLFDGFKGRISIHAPGGIRTATDDPAEREFTRNRFHQAIDFAHDIGATHMVVEPWLFSFSNATILPAHMPRMADFSYGTLQPLVAHAEDKNVTLVLENVPEVFPHLLIDLVRRFESKHVRMCLDTGHAYLMHHQHGAPVPDEWVRQAGDLLAHLHIADNDGEMDRHWGPGDGEIAWYPMFQRLNELTEMPRLILELQPERARRGLAYFTAAGYAR